MDSVCQSQAKVMTMHVIHVVIHDVYCVSLIKSLSMKSRLQGSTSRDVKCPSSPGTSPRHAVYASPCVFSRLERDVGVVFSEEVTILKERGSLVIL